VPLRMFGAALFGLGAGYSRDGSASRERQGNCSHENVGGLTTEQTSSKSGGGSEMIVTMALAQTIRATFVRTETPAGLG